MTGSEAMRTYQDIQVEIVDPVCTIRLNRPDKLNALSYHMLGELRRAIDDAAADQRVVGIVITGNGRGFCSGLDSQALVETTAAGSSGRDTSAAAQAETPGMFTYLLSVPKPVIAAVNGVAAGGGLVLAALCDVRFASTEASFTTVFLKRGLIAEHGTSWLLPRMLGPGRALDLLWSSRRIGADEALSTGMVEYVVPAEDLVARAQDYVRELSIAASPAAMAETKRMVYEHLGLGHVDALRDADAAQWRALDSDDSTEGARALIEKRNPQFPRLGQTGASA